MGNIIPGVIGRDGFQLPDDSRDPGESPGSSWTDQGPVGLDTGGGGSGKANLKITGWPRSITWGEFKELPARPSGENEDAQIHSEVDQPSEVAVVREGGELRVSALTVTIRTVTEDDWVVTSQKSAELLSHEQGHYDITGLMGRDMGNEIVAARASSRDDLQTKVTQIIQKYAQRAKDLSAQYDEETKNGRNREAQKKWDDKIRSAMQSGARFTAP